MKAENRGSGAEDKSEKTLEEQLAYVNETIKESENEDSASSADGECRASEARTKTENRRSEDGASQSEAERRECDCCRVVPDEIINMNCVHNICVDCTLNVSCALIAANYRRRR